MEIHVLATGGMRLLPAPVAQGIQASVTRTLREGGYRPGRVETISGEMEGFYAWLDVNVLLGQLGPGKAPVGIVEIGGASVQAAYPGAPASAPGVVTASFAGETYSVRSVSFLGLGIEQARKTLLENGDGAPCYPEGLASAMPERNGARGAFDADRCASAISRIVEAPTRSLPKDEVRNVRFLGLGKPLTGVLADWNLADDKGASLKQPRVRSASRRGANSRASMATHATRPICASIRSISRRCCSMRADWVSRPRRSSRPTASRAAAQRGRAAPR